MYTQCPNCQEAFRVTAEILQQAAGRVRCGSCAHVFDALDGLSEAPPCTDAPAAAEERSFRDALEELGDGGDIRIEDTGVEWRVVEEETGTDLVDAKQDNDPSDASALRWSIEDVPEEPQNDPVIPEANRRAREEPLELDTTTEAEERYDDNTPLPGLIDDDEEDDAPAIPEMPRRRARDFIEPRSRELDERQVDLALGEPEEWTDLLEEVGDADDAEPAAASARSGPLEEAAEDPHPVAGAPEADEEPTAEHPVFHAGELTLVDDDAAGERESRRELARDIEERAGIEIEAEDIEEELELLANEGADGDAVESAESTGELEQLGEPPAPAADGGAAHRVPPPSEEEMTLDRLIDQDLLRLTGEHEDLTATGSGTRSAAVPPHVETIVMEGELVRSSLHDDVTQPEAGGEAPLEQFPAPEDTYIHSRDDAHAVEESPGPARYSGIAAAALLALSLAAQLVHAYRETLATYEVFNDTLGAAYRGLGAPITPDWDINGWQFRDTRGSTDASNSALTISSHITNRSEQTLPYPLLHVTLTDRYEEVVGSQLLEPAQYLAIRSARGMLDPGEDFTATVTIAPLSADAAGFKLNVCYPIDGARVRCATGTFKR